MLTINASIATLRSAHRIGWQCTKSRVVWSCSPRRLLLHLLEREKVEVLVGLLLLLLLLLLLHLLLSFHVHLLHDIIASIAAKHSPNATA